MSIVAVDSSHQSLSCLQDSKKFIEWRDELKHFDVDCAVPQDVRCIRHTFPGRPIPPNPP
jgi:hypothetical protein